MHKGGLKPDPFYFFSEVSKGQKDNIYFTISPCVKQSGGITVWKKPHSYTHYGKYEDLNDR